MKRKSPVRHRVKSHVREGSRVESFTRGKGTPTIFRIKKPIKESEQVKAYVIHPFYSKPFSKTTRVTNNKSLKPMSKKEAEKFALKLRRKYPTRKISVEQNKSPRYNWWDYFVRIQIKEK